ncbi:hypothetical protein MANY_38400 [Mycolicibacterium anyangense]|uniref:Uncharacterized protein n=1 Tax=Mycolicibacterium anyangense TaxID=1431246 RepID=A0A6N4WDN8_9MYCO|nr:hypothetical protein MANY_38400 [Mycolicibacterium anyangense]
MNSTTNHTLDGPAFTLTGVRLTGLTVKSFFLRTLDLGMGTFGTNRCDDGSQIDYEINAATPRADTRGTGDDDGPTFGVALRRPSGVPAGRPAAGRHARRLRWR